MKNVNIKKLGRAGIITIDLSVEELSRASKMLPGITKALDKQGNEVFVVTTGPIEAVSKHGICFANNDRNGRATVTFVTDAAEMTKEEIITELGEGLLNLNHIVDTIKNVIGRVESELEQFFDDEEELAATPVEAEEAPEFTQLELPTEETDGE
jgi:hypothetical protein